MPVITIATQIIPIQIKIVASVAGSIIFRLLVSPQSILADLKTKVIVECLFKHVL
jgi:hypothetical protein